MAGVALRDTGLRLRDLQALARAAEDVGYGSIWVPEVGSRDALALAALYGSVTKRVTIATGVVPVYSRHPASLSLAVACAAEACEGRFVLGLGAGHRFTAEAWYGQRWTDPRGRLRETAEVLRRILAGERVSHRGTFTLESFHLASTPPAVPIYFAALSPASLRLAGEVGDGVVLNWLPPEGVEKAAFLAREAAADVGRRIRVVAYVRAAVVADEALDHAARQALREQTYAYLSLPVYANSVRRVGLGREVDAMLGGGERAVDALVDALCVTGEPAAARRALRAWQETGVDSVVVYPVPVGDEGAPSVLNTIRALAPTAA